jgi:hypothetical protein
MSDLNGFNIGGEMHGNMARSARRLERSAGGKGVESDKVAAILTQIFHSGKGDSEIRGFEHLGASD